MVNAPMVDSTSQNTLAKAGLAALIIPILVWVRWMYVFSSNPDMTQEEKLERFLSWFPGFLHSANAVSALVLVFSAGSIVFSALGRRKADETFKVLGVFAIVLASLITLLQVFTLL